MEVARKCVLRWEMVQRAAATVGCSQKLYISCGGQLRGRKVAARRGLTSFDCLSNDPVR
jgi:hypothetical protein